MKMIRHASYRNLPAVVTGFEQSSLVENESFLVKEDKATIEGVYNQTSCSKVSTTPYAPKEHVFRGRKHIIISYESLDVYCHRDDHENDDLSYTSDVNDERITSDGHTISAVIDDLLSDSSEKDNEEDAFFIEEKPVQKYYNESSQTLHMYRSYSEPLMTIHHYSLHTIEEESQCSDDCSLESNDELTDGKLIKNNEDSETTITLSLLRHQSVPCHAELIQNEYNNDKVDASRLPLTCFSRDKLNN